MNVNIKMETNSINDYPESLEVPNNIKLEPELIIESDCQWLPIKLEDEQNDYQEYCLEFNEDQIHCINSQEDIKNKSSHQLYTIKYLDENEDYDEKEEQDENDASEDDDDDDSDDEGILNTEYNEDREYNLQLELYAEDIERKNKVFEDNETNFLFKCPLKYWLLKNYVQRICPECNEKFAAFKELRTHIELNHQDSIKEAQNAYYYFPEQHLVKCKKCRCEYAKNDYIRYEHSVKHWENGEELSCNRCKICSQKLTKSIHTHFVEEHPEVVDEFDNTTNVNKPLRCPICHHIYGNNKYSKLWYHFMDKHPLEHQDKFRYNCHLCEHERFARDEEYFQHLMVDHELNSWKVLNFRKLFTDKEYLACLKCHRVYLKNNTITFLKHYLEHDSSTYWSCRFCLKKIFYKYTGRSGHMCSKLLNYYNRRHKETNNEDNNKKTNRIENLQEFEEYITHVCPFCKEEFNELLKWQQHLRNIHAIDTLKGLEMTVIAAADNNKLRCVICHTMVANTTIQLHAHRFQHLPFKPYKCRHCTQTLATFKMAVNHVVKRCKDEEDRDYINQVLIPNKTYLPKVEIQCAFCNYQKFANAKEALTHYQEVHNNFEEYFYRDDGGDNLMSCIVCQKKILQYDPHIRLLHVLRHFDEKTFKCPLCEFSYVGENACICHIKKLHHIKPLELIKSLKEINQIVLKKESDKVIEHQFPAALSTMAKPGMKSHVLNEFAEFITFACPECNDGMTNQEDWHTHITTQHDFFDESNVSFKDSNGSLKCITCKLNLPAVSLHRLKHKLTHMPYRSFICNLCYARFNSLGVLYGHFRRKHFAQGSFKCAICPEVLATSHQRTEHLKQTHPPNEWPKHMCLICYRVLGSKSGLNTHMITHDAERVRYTCDVCGSKLVERKEFKNHVARHKERGEIKMNNDDEIPSKSGFVETKANVMDVKTDLNNVNVEVKSKKAITNIKSKSLRNQPDDMKEKGVLDNVDVKSKKANLNNKRKSKKMNLNNKRKCVKNNPSDIEQEMDTVDVKTDTKRKSLRNSTKKRKCYAE